MLLRMVHLKVFIQSLCLALSLSGAVASDKSVSPERKAAGGFSFPEFGNFFGDSGFAFNFQSMLESMNKMMHGPLETLGKSAVEIKHDRGTDGNKCHFIVHFGHSVTASDLSVSFDPQHRLLFVGYSRQEKSQNTDDVKSGGKIFRASVSKSSSRASTLIPDYCIATPQSLKNGYGGWTDNLDEADAEHHEMMIAFPSYDEIAKLVESGEVPADAVALVASPNPRADANLTHFQHCLISGFSKEECQVLGDVRPSSEISPDARGHLSVPRYLVSLHTFRPRN